MADKKYQVFIFSTYQDLIEHRLDIAKSVLDLGQIPAAMGNWPASDEDQFRFIRKIIDQCDYYVLVIAGKYGSEAPDGISYTEKEYDYAKSQDKFVLGFPIDDMGRLPRDQTEVDVKKIEKLNAFREKVMSGRMVRLWKSREHLDNVVTKALSVAFIDFPQEGWVRSPKNSNEHLLEEINDLPKENLRLDTEVKALRSPSRTDLDLADWSTNITFNTWGRTLERVSQKSHTMSWFQIFMNIATVLRGVVSRSDLSKSFATLIDSEASHFFAVGVEERAWELILIQMTAYGFIGTEDRTEYELTKLGLEKYTQSAVLRKS